MRPADRDSARTRLLELGAAAAEPLAARLSTASDDHARACLAVLGELGPAGGGAVPALIAMLRRDSKRPRCDFLLEVLEVLADLIPYRPDDVELSDRDLTVSISFIRQPRDPTALPWSLAWQRLRERNQFPRHQDLEALLVLAQDRRPWVIEAAIEQLGALGPPAARAVPVLRGVLERPEPLVVPIGEPVPLHRKAARALLVIAPDAEYAATARAVLDGTWTPPAPHTRPVPERARRRVEELLVELAGVNAARRSAAAENLTALGALAADSVATLLTPANADETVDVALEVLRRMGKDAAGAVPSLATALTTLQATHTVAVIKALAATAPWSEHVCLSPMYSGGVGQLVIQGQKIAGTIDVPFLNAFGSAMQEFNVAMTVPVDGSPERLRDLLADSWVARRRRALEVIAARGSQCATLLETIAPMLTAPHPPEYVSEWTDEQSHRSTKVDRTDDIQRLAATAIVAIAPADHPLVAVARERLARPATK